MFYIKLYFLFTAGWQNWLCFWTWQVVVWSTRCERVERETHKQREKHPSPGYINFYQWLLRFSMPASTTKTFQISVCAFFCTHKLGFNLILLFNLSSPHLSKPLVVRLFKEFTPANTSWVRWFWSKRSSVYFNKIQNSMSGINSLPFFMSGLLNCSHNISLSYLIDSLFTGLRKSIVLPCFYLIDVFS